MTDLSRDRSERQRHRTSDQNATVETKVATQSGFCHERANPVLDDLDQRDFLRRCNTEGTVLKHQAAFTDALRSDRKMRKCIFDTIEQRHAYDFRNSSVGPRLYEDLLSAVRDSGATEAINEFENRFSPLLNSDPSRDDADFGPSAGIANRASVMADRRRGGWGIASAVCVVAFLAPLVVGFNAFKITAAEATKSAAKATGPASETMTAPAQAAATEEPIAATKATEPASGMVTEELSATPAELELSRE
jgi:hypothetical protein